MKNFTAIRRVLLLTMALNLLATAAKLGVGYLTGSLSMVADGLDALFDSASNVVGVIGIYIAARPPDESHPYGHRKFETLAALGIAVLLFITCVEIVQSAVERLASAHRPDVTPLSFTALLVGIVLNAATAFYEGRRGRELKSDVLIADASHTRASIFVSLSVIGGLIAVRLGMPAVDPLLAIVIAGVIAKIGLDIVLASAQVLSDAAALNPAEIERIARSVAGVQHVEQVRSRGHADDVQIDLHVQVDPQLGILPAHAIGHQVKDRLLDRLEGVGDVTVHVEPAYPPPGLRDVVAEVRRVAALLPAAIHNVHVLQVENRLSVDLDLEVDDSLNLAQAHDLATRLEEAIRREVPGIIEVTSHIEPMDAKPLRVRASQPLAAVLQQELDTAMAELPEIRNCHCLSVHEIHGHLFASVQCECDGALPVAQAHQLANELEHRLKDCVPHLERVQVHIEPSP
jgi:cation diffusion facilitator family transporter